MKSLFMILALGAMWAWPCAAPGLAQTPANLYPGLENGGSLAPCVRDYLGKDTSSLVEPPDMEMIKAHHNFGFTDAEIQKYFTYPLTIALDKTGMDTSRIKAPPAPFVHPRILFNPEELPAIRSRIANTESGKLVMTNIRKQITKNLTGPNASFAAGYEALANGDTTVSVTGGNGRDFIAYLVLYESFRCLIDQDDAGGKKAAAATATLARITSQMIDANVAKEKARKDGGAPTDFRVVAQGPTFEGTLGLDYDFTYNWMTEDQRSTVRQALTKGSSGMTYIGCETLRALQTNSSNWIPWSTRMLFVVCALEGEPGYDKGAYDRCVAAQTGFVGSIYPTGEAFEGWGKCFMFLEHLVIMAKRNKDILSAAPIRAAFNNYYISSMNPWGSDFTFCDSLGGTGNKISRNADIMIYKALFPEDVSADFVYRNQIDADYTSLTEKNGINTRHPFLVTDALCCALFATDLRPDTTWDQEFGQVTNGRPETYFSEDTCNMMTRSAWSKDAVYLNYLNRSVPGGHRYCDRSHFSLYALERYWSIYHFMRQAHDQYLPGNRSVVLADGEGPSIAPAKCVGFSDQPLATFIATDLSVPWDYISKGLFPSPDKSKYTQLPFSPNYFRLHASPIPSMNMGFDDLPNWATSMKPAEGQNLDWWKRDPEVKKAFRTAGLVRGTHPYTLIVDDLQKDDQAHLYDWGMILADDLVLGTAKMTSAEGADHPTADAVIEETAPVFDARAKAGAPARPAEAGRHLLVRVLEASQLNASRIASVEKMPVKNEPMAPSILNKFHLTSQSVSPNFKMLLFAYRDGQELPVTTWSADHSSVTVAWKDQVDRIVFNAGADGRTRLAITRGQDKLIDFR